MTKSKPSFPPSIREVILQIAGLTPRVDALVKSQESEPNASVPDPAIKPILSSIYESMGQIEKSISYSTNESTILKAWLALLAPIHGLSALQPHGGFLAARMLLYFMDGFMESRHSLRTFDGGKKMAECAALLLRLDDTLLGYFKLVWKQSRAREEFKWAFSDHGIPSRWHQDLEQQDEYRAHAAAASPHELFALGGGLGRRVWCRSEGDTAVYPMPAHARQWSFTEPASESNAEPLLKTFEIGTDGPLRKSYNYSVAIPGAGTQSHHMRPVLQRSRQFALDARKIAAVHIHEDRLRLAQVILERIRPLPAELREMVYGYIVTETRPDLYVEKLDLESVYRPFPEHMKDSKNGTCRICAGKPPDDAAMNRKRSCPLKTIIVWNLPLRAFMSFHLFSERTGHSTVYVPCRYRDCHETRRHHDSADWEMSQDVDGELGEFLNSTIRERHGAEASLDTVGLGRIENMVLLEQADCAQRQQGLFRGPQELADKNAEWRWKGIAGLLDAMVHGCYLRGVNVYENQHVGRTLYGLRNHAEWMYGLKKSDEEVVRVTYRQRGNIGRGHCEVCI